MVPFGGSPLSGNQNKYLSLYIMMQICQMNFFLLYQICPQDNKQLLKCLFSEWSQKSNFFYVQSLYKYEVVS